MALSKASREESHYVCPHNDLVGVVLFSLVCFMICFNLTTFGFQQFLSDGYPVEPGCIMKSSKTVLVQSIELPSLSTAMGAALLKGIQPVHSTITSYLQGIVNDMISIT